MKDNAIRLYKHYCNMAENPIGVDAKEKELVRNNAIKAKADMENRFKTAKKYRNDADIKELLGIKEEVKEEVLEDKPNAKKSK